MWANHRQCCVIPTWIWCRQKPQPLWTEFTQGKAYAWSQSLSAKLHQHLYLNSLLVHRTATNITILKWSLCSYSNICWSVSPTLQNMWSVNTWTSDKTHTFHMQKTGAYLPQTIFLLCILQQHIVNFPCNILIYVVQSQWLQQTKPKF
jgi:hypothetical protein